MARGVVTGAGRILLSAHQRPVVPTAGRNLFLQIGEIVIDFRQEGNDVAHVRIPASAIALFGAANMALPAAAEIQAEPQSATSESQFDTEHIFGFGEGSDVGNKGELEIESFTIGIFGASGRNFNIGNETSLRYSVIDGLRFSVGALTDYLNIHKVHALSARNGMNASGLIAEVRYNIFDRLNSPFGMTITVDPEWRRTDQASGRYNDNFSVTAALLIDKEVIPETFFMELNLVYSPTFLPLAGRWLRDDSFTVIVGGSYAITPAILVGAEIRHENLAPSISPNAHALFAGPHMFLRLADSLTASFAWAFQLPDLGARHSDLENFDRYEAGLRIVYSF